MKVFFEQDFEIDLRLYDDIKPTIHRVAERIASQLITDLSSGAITKENALLLLESGFSFYVSDNQKNELAYALFRKKVLISDELYRSMQANFDHAIEQLVQDVEAGRIGHVELMQHILGPEYQDLTLLNGEQQERIIVVMFAQGAEQGPLTTFR